MLNQMLSLTRHDTEYQYFHFFIANGNGKKIVHIQILYKRNQNVLLGVYSHAHTQNTISVCLDINVVFNGISLSIIYTQFCQVLSSIRCFLLEILIVNIKFIPSAFCTYNKWFSHFKSNSHTHREIYIPPLQLHTLSVSPTELFHFEMKIFHNGFFIRFLYRQLLHKSHEIHIIRHYIFFQ